MQVLTIPRWKDMASHYMDADILKRFPREWYEFLKGGSRESLVRDPIVSLAAACFAIVDIYGLGGMDVAMAGPRHILEVFQGNIPKSLESGWLDHDPLLKPLVTKAYRYAFKVLLDQVSIGDIESNEDLKVGALLLSIGLHIPRAHLRNMINHGLWV